MEQDDIEKEKLKFEKEKFEKELKLKEREIALKERESSRPQSKITPTQVTFLVTIFGIFGTIFGVWLQSNSNQKLERLKFESEIILKVATSDSIEQNKKNLKFLLSAGFIRDPEGKINKLVNDSGFDLKINSSLYNAVDSRKPYFEFSDISLEHALFEISLEYGVSIFYDKSDINSFRITIGNVSRSLPLSEILERIEKSCGITFKMDGKTLELNTSPLVFFCPSLSSFSYHKKVCPALKTCTPKILTTTIQQAVAALDKHPCKICYE